MTTTCSVSKILKVYLFSLLCLLPSSLFAESGSGIVDPSDTGANEAQAPAPGPKDLLEKAAVLSLDENDKQATADLYYEVHKKFPETPEAEKALWQTIVLTEELAKAGEQDWEVVRNLSREFVSYYPGGEYAAKAYLQQGIALYHMNYQREALSYFKLSEKRFPEAAVASEAKLWQAKSLIELGRLNEADEIYGDLAETETGTIKLRADVGKAEILTSKKEYGTALKIYHKLARKKSDFFRDEPEALRIFGKANLFAGNIAKGQSQLIHYLNLVEDPLSRVDVLFDVGESYWRQKKFQAAQKMYKRVIKEGNATRHSVIFSHMRISQYLDDPNRPAEKWDKPHELTDPEGDKSYLRVLDLFYNDPLAQDARRSLFWRFHARKDLENMLDYGKNFLRLARINDSSDEKQEAGKIFMAIGDALLENERYQDLYDIYYSEYEYIKDYPNGRLLYLVGQAMETLAIYDQASVIYYRALKWPLSEKDKIDLYYRRANVYLINKDYESADRLLKYLREIYEGKKEVGEVYYLSGKLREAQKRERDALAFYRKAVEIMTFSEKKSEYAAAAVRLLFLLNGSDAFGEIEEDIKSGYLSGPDLQKMYASAADLLRQKGEYKKAAEIYEAALVEGLPQDGKLVQSIYLYLGDCLIALQKNKEALEYYQKAQLGEDSLLKKMAQERINQNAIDMELSRLKNDGGSL